jgi:hypothetical protein
MLLRKETRKNMTYRFIIFLLSIGSFIHAQSWDTLSYQPSQRGLELNPLKGFATMFQPSNNFPRSIQGKLFGLDEIMFGIDNFNWSVIDNFLIRESVQGRHCYIQVNIDPAFGNSDMPAFLVDKVDWQYYDDGNLPDLCPDWNDPDLMDAMLNFIEAFGQRYNDDPRVFLVHLGLYGMWGEWHIGSIAKIRPEFEMTEANKTLIANAYKQSFPTKPLLARYPEHMPDPQIFGYSDGLFFGQSISASNPFYFHNTLKNYHADKNWMLHPIGGEIDPDLQSKLFIDLPNRVGQDIFQSMDAIRPTWLFSHNILTEVQEGTAEWFNAIRVQKAMGYTFHINKYRLSAGRGVPIVEVNIQNKGLAPIYANWEVDVSALDADNNVHSLGTADWQLNLIQPDITNNYRSFVSDLPLTDGTYTLLIKITNPLTAYSLEAQPVRFANSTQDEHRDGWLSLGKLTISNGNAGAPRIPVKDYTLSPANAEIEVGDTLRLNSEVWPSDATIGAVTYQSDHPMTASVDENGLVKAGPHYGTAIIYAYTQDGGIVEQSIITVKPKRISIPAKIEAEDYIRMSGVVKEGSFEGGQNLGYIDNNDWIEYGVKVDEAALFTLDLRVASQPGGGEIRLVNEANETLDIITVPTTNGWQSYTTISSKLISLPVGEYNLRIVAAKGNFNLNWIEFIFNSTVAVNDNLELNNSISIFPNPTNGIIKLDWNDRHQSIPFTAIKVKNLWGVDVRPHVYNTYLDITALPKGVYLLEIPINEYRIVKKVIKY